MPSDKGKMPHRATRTVRRAQGPRGARVLWLRLLLGRPSSCYRPFRGFNKIKRIKGRQGGRRGDLGDVAGPPGARIGIRAAPRARPRPPALRAGQRRIVGADPGPGPARRRRDLHALQSQRVKVRSAAAPPARPGAARRPAAGILVPAPAPPLRVNGRAPPPSAALCVSARPAGPAGDVPARPAPPPAPLAHANQPGSASGRAARPGAPHGPGQEPLMCPCGREAPSPCQHPLPRPPARSPRSVRKARPSGEPAPAPPPSPAPLTSPTPPPAHEAGCRPPSSRKRPLTLPSLPHLPPEGLRQRGGRCGLALGPPHPHPQRAGRGLRHLEPTDWSHFKGNIADPLKMASFLFFHVGAFRLIIISFFERIFLNRLLEKEGSLQTKAVSPWAPLDMTRRGLLSVSPKQWQAWWPQPGLPGRVPCEASLPLGTSVPDPVGPCGSPAGSPGSTGSYTGGSTRGTRPTVNPEERPGRGLQLWHKPVGPLRWGGVCEDREMGTKHRCPPSVRLSQGVRQGRADVRKVHKGLGLLAQAIISTPGGAGRTGPLREAAALNLVESSRRTSPPLPRAGGPGTFCSLDCRPRRK